jgi:hypothetical protein
MELYPTLILNREKLKGALWKPLLYWSKKCGESASGDGCRKHSTHPCNSEIGYCRCVRKGMACRGVHSVAGRWRSDRTRPEPLLAAS